MPTFRFLLLFAVILPLTLAAQIKTKTPAAPPAQLFTAASDDRSPSGAITTELSEYTLFQTSPENYAALRESRPRGWSLVLPPASPAASPLTLNLRPRPLTRADFRLRRGLDDSVFADADLGQHFVGEIAGQPGSRVALSLLDHEVTATITYANGSRLALGRVQDQPAAATELYALFPDRQLLERQDLDCATADSGIPYSAKELAQPENGKSTGGCVDVYFEIDHDIVVDKGGVNAAAQHLAANFNEVAILYEAIGVNLTISEIRVWDTPSPYAGNSSTAMLTQFQAERTQFNGDLAQLVSYQASGGVAVLDGLCHPFIAARMSFASIRPGFQSVPIYSWSTMVISHELGHLMGSQHTHACVWNGNDTAIDGCPGWTEGFCGTPGLPQNGGTIMSYCHLTAVGINFNEGFGPQPTAVIRNRVAAAQGCVQAVCDGGGNPDPDPDTDPDPDPDPEEEPDTIMTCPAQTVYVNLTLDDFGMETTWELRAEGGQVYATGGPYPKKQKGRVVRDTVCVPDGCYLFTISDDDFDGICCDYGPGRYELLDSLGNVLGSGGSFDTLDVVDFCLPDLPDEEEEEDDGCVAFNFVETPVVTYGTNQDVGSATILDDGATIHLRDNAWKALELPYTITEHTWVSFWFRSTRRGEMHGIGFDDNEVISPTLTFQLYGTQNWGLQDFHDYPGDGQWRLYQIPVGQFYTGEAAYLFFTADHDVGTGDGNSYFRDVTVSEGGGCGANGLPLASSPETATPVRVFPNPANDQLTLVAGGDIAGGNYEVIDLAGRVLAGGQLDASRTTIQVAELPAGTYLLRCGNGAVSYTRRFTVVH